MRICRNCISQIPDDVKKCPNCGKNPMKENTILDKIVIFFTLFITIILATGMYFLIFNNNIDFKVQNKNNKNNEVEEAKGSFLKGEKTTICTKVEKDNGYTTQTKYSVVSKKNIVKKFTSEVISKYDDSETFKWSYAFIKEFYDSFGELEGFSSNIENNDENTYTAIIEIDYDKINFDKLYKYFNIENENEYGFYKKDITIDEFRNNLDGYTCK